MVPVGFLFSAVPERLPVRQEGPDTGPPVVCLPGETTGAPIQPEDE
jgi:hypothetical protein